MNVRPLHDRIIVQRIEEGEQKVGGIIIPDTAKEKPQQGKVVAVGKGKTKDDGTVVALDVKAGDTHPLRQVLRSGNQDRRRGIPHHARGRSSRRAAVASRLFKYDAAGPVRPIKEHPAWQSRLFTERTRARRSSAA